MVEEKYGNYISLDENFKDVFSLEDDIYKDTIWRRFILTNSFKKILESIEYIFYPENNANKKAIILTGKYGVGKSHATAFLSHLLWDKHDTIQDLLLRAKNELEIPGNILYQFRQENRYFPVILSGRDSNDVSDTKSFEYHLQIGLERALRENEFLDQIQEKTEFEKYYLWLENLSKDPSNASLLEVISVSIQQKSDFSSIEELKSALKDRNLDSIEMIKKIFSDWDIPSPRHCDTLGYYDSVLQELQKIDRSILGIIIFWDEFTTVFNTAGKYNDANLLAQIQTWAEKSDSNIFLFLVSHQSPEALRGRYELINDSLAKISDRFKISSMVMEQVTTYHLIANTLQIEKKQEFSEFLEKHGFSNDVKKEIDILYTEIFSDTFCELDILRRTFPLHPYSVLVATKIADLIGSAERSIFELIHSKSEEKISFGKKLGFARFLEMEPGESKISWYTLDQIFDFFYNDLADHQFDPIADANMIKPLNAFQHYYDIVKIQGKEAEKVFKIVVILEMLHAQSLTSSLLTTKNNILKALAFTEINEPEAILQQLTTKSILLDYFDDKSKKTIYKTRFGGYDDEEIRKYIEDLKEKKGFDDLLKTINQKIIAKIKIETNDSPRIKNNHANIIINSIKQIEKIENQISNYENESKLNIFVFIPLKIGEFDISRNKLVKLSSHFKNSIFISYEGNFDKIYDRWLEGQAISLIGQQRSNQTMKNQAAQQIESAEQLLITELNRSMIYFRGASESRPHGIGSLKQHINDIYYRGFDFVVYDYFWGSPKSSSGELIQYYGKKSGRKLIEEHKTNYVRRFVDLFKDIDENPLIDTNLLLKIEQPYVKNSSLYEIVSNIKKYVDDHNGTWISLRSLIDTLNLEKPPYGLCGWIESLIITYSLAEYINEGRLEVQLGNQTASKDNNKIIEAINNVIKTPSNDQKIRYGSFDELKLSRKLINIFGLGSEVKTSINEVLVRIREQVNLNFNLPLWTIPYSQTGKKKETLEKIFNTLQTFLIDSNADRIISEHDIDSLLDNIDTLESHDKQIWTKIVTKEMAYRGFNQFLQTHYPQLLIQYDPLDKLIEDLKNELHKDPWSWDEKIIFEKLSFLATHSHPPGSPSNVNAYQESEGIIVVWDIPPPDDPIPTNYIIERSEDQIQFYLIAKEKGTITRFVDRTTKPGNKYYYRIISENRMGKSEPSDIISLKVLRAPPDIPVSIIPREECIHLSWEIPKKEYAITSYDLFRGTSPTHLTSLREDISQETSDYTDYEVQPHLWYYYRLSAKNSAGERGSGIISQKIQLITNKPPSMPINSNLSVEKKSVRLSWQYPDSGKESVKEFYIYRQEQEGDLKLISSISPEHLNYIDKGIQNGINYVYFISAGNENGEGQKARIGNVQFLPEIPLPKLLCKEKEGGVLLSWQTYEKGYEIVNFELKKGKSLKSLKKLVSLDGTSNEYFDDSIKPENTYYYDLIVQNSKGDTRNLDDIVKFKLNLHIDISTWEGQTTSLLKSEPRLFLKQLKDILKSNEHLKLEKNDEKIINKLIKVLEELKNE
ncbi:hypothetical protein J2741_001481 [Methanolinea mesophila]|uniref:fibronectin type III domain-containing protein n=1 Tax=Methanolinea mesophila TaxID=547055 RepID=UPI001AE8468B|nr:fibronectin type III domain-containing protein [Methanolinea mesophila]MBP1928934.1 hypothetical protein [Methanolinea mesophila]